MFGADPFGAVPFGDEAPDDSGGVITAPSGGAVLLLGVAGAAAPIPPGDAFGVWESGVWDETIWASGVWE